MGYILVGMMVEWGVVGRGRRHWEKRFMVEVSAAPIRALFRAVMKAESDWR
jgi:hypothetical protein